MKILVALVLLTTKIVNDYGKVYQSLGSIGVLKILFGREISKDLLVDFLNDLFNGEHSIVDLTFLNVELPSETIEGRGAIFDLKCKDADGAVLS